MKADRKGGDATQLLMKPLMILPATTTDFQQNVESDTSFNC